MMTQVIRKKCESLRWGPLVVTLGLFLAAGPVGAQGDAVASRLRGERKWSAMRRRVILYSQVERWQPR